MSSDDVFRPKEHHAFDVLHWIKASFKRLALDRIAEVDALNKEADRVGANHVVVSEAR